MLLSGLRFSVFMAYTPRLADQYNDRCNVIIQGYFPVYSPHGSFPHAAEHYTVSGRVPSPALNLLIPQ